MLGILHTPMDCPSGGHQIAAGEGEPHFPPQVASRPSPSLYRACVPLATISNSPSAYAPLYRTCCAWIHPVVSTAADTHSVKPPSSNSSHSPFPPTPHPLPPTPLSLPAPRALCFLPVNVHTMINVPASEGVEVSSERPRVAPQAPLPANEQHYVAHSASHAQPAMPH